MIEHGSEKTGDNLGELTTVRMQTTKSNVVASIHAITSNHTLEIGAPFDSSKLELRVVKLETHSLSLRQQF